MLIELHQYSEVILSPQNRDALICWQENKPTFPALNKLVVRYMGITATSILTEQVFSKAEEVLSKKWKRLKGKTVNMLLFLNKKLLNEGKVSISAIL